MLRLNIFHRLEDRVDLNFQKMNKSNVKIVQKSHKKFKNIFLKILLKRVWCCQTHQNNDRLISKLQHQRHPKMNPSSSFPSCRRTYARHLLPGVGQHVFVCSPRRKLCQSTGLTISKLTRLRPVRLVSKFMNESKRPLRPRQPQRNKSIGQPQPLQHSLHIASASRRNLTKKAIIMFREDGNNEKEARNGDGD